ncbi:MAG: ribosomal protein S19 family protein, partial [Promethearchaeota archaeon]
MSPNEEHDNEEQKEMTTEEETEEPSEELEEEIDSKELDLAKERDRLKFHYRGYTLEELKKMNMDEFIQLLPARARRSLRRGLPPRQKKLLERLRRAYRAKKRGKDILTRTHVRDMLIFPDFVGLKIGVYNGKSYEIVEV